MANFDLENIVELMPPNADSQGRKEGDEWDKYDDELYEQQHNFKMRLNRLLFHLAKFTIAIIWSILMILTLIWFYHIATPNCWHYLDDKALQTVERILFSSALISVGGKYFGKFKLLDPANRPNHLR